MGLLLCTLPLVGCPGPATHTQSSVDPGFGVSDVELLEVYTYRFSTSPQVVRRAVVTDRREISTWVAYLTDLPASPADPDPGELAGLETDGFRFHLRNGTSYEVTHLFRGRPDVLVWPDGTVMETDYGSPTGYSGELADPDDRPTAAIE